MVVLPETIVQYTRHVEVQVLGLVVTARIAGPVHLDAQAVALIRRVGDLLILAVDFVLVVFDVAFVEPQVFLDLFEVLEVGHAVKIVAQQLDDLLDCVDVLGTGDAVGRSQVEEVADVFVDIGVVGVTYLGFDFEYFVADGFDCVGLGFFL